MNIFRAAAREFTRVDRTCNNCGREIFGGDAVGEKYFCADCFSHLPLNNGNICARCGRSAVHPANSCDDCSGREIAYVYARSCFYYAPPVDTLIKNLKYNNDKYLAEVLSAFLKFTAAAGFPKTDVITFPPVTARTLRERGYNQSELLSRKVGRAMNVPVEEVFSKTEGTERQAKLGRNDRLKNLKNAIKVRNRALVAGKTVLLIDDVMTTGATSEICSSLLKKAGASSVYVLTAASVTNSTVARALGQECSSARAGRKRKRAVFRQGSAK